MISLHPEDSTPLYEQLYRALAGEIRSGARAPGKPLPGRRSMAAQLGVSVSTVDTAYQMLAAEGLAESRPRRGFFVQETGGMLQTGPARAAAPASPPQKPAAPAFRYDLSTTGIDTALFPARSWGRIQRDLLYSSPQLLQRGEAQGDAELRAAIADYLGAYRGVRCTPEQVVVGAGIEYLLGCLAHLFAGGTAAVENPGYSRARAVLQNSGIPCLPADIDKSGLSAAGAGPNRGQPVLHHPQPPLSHRRDHARPPPGPAAGLGPGGARPLYPGGRLRLGVPVRHPAAAQPAGHGGPRRAGGLPDHLFQEPGPPASASPAWCCRGPLLGPVPAGFCPLLQHGQPV